MCQRRDFDRLFRHGRVGRWGPVAVRAAANQEDTVRLALAVGRRVGKAVVRNRLRRRVREAVRAQLSFVRPGTDLLVSVRPEGAGLPFRELCSALRGALKKAGVWLESRPS